ncbi:MAG: ATP-binding response regulator [Solirubrobacteraceae bacterium]
MKFTSEGFIEVRVEVRDDADAGAVQRLALVVRDTGIGVSQSDQERLFAPFEQASSDAARSSGGTGLGLVVCRQLVEAMAGTVEMASELGQGTTMRVELPLPVADEAADGGRVDDDGAGLARRALPARADAERARSLLLLVEDHPVNREILASQLEAIGSSRTPPRTPSRRSTTTSVAATASS